MVSAYIVLVTLLALTTLASSQILGDPGKEPWFFGAVSDCNWKGTGYLDNDVLQAQQCIEALYGSPGSDPVAVCSKRDERNKCLEHYYNLTKTCYLEDEGKKQVDEAFKAQDEAVNYACDDNGERLKEIAKDDQCQAKKNSSCLEKLIEDIGDEGSGLFRENKCKIMHGLVKCEKAQFDHCNTTLKADFAVGQMNAILGATPCGEASGTSSILNALVAPILVFCLLCLSVIKAIF